LLESAFIAVTVEMSYNGIRLDEEAWLANAIESAKLAEELREEFISLLKADRSEAMMEFKKSIQSPSLFEEDHLEINLNSPLQMIPLFKALGINLENQKASKKKSKSGNVSADTLEESVLKKYKSIPLVDTYIKYRHATKEASTYGSMFLKKFLNPATGRLHSSFNSVNTGRLSSSNPNLQNIPRSKRFRKCFIPGKDKTLVVADYSAQEVRSLAAVTNEEKLIAFLSEKGADIHKFTASNIFSKPLESITDDERYLGKVVNFLIPYGGGASNLQQLTGRDLDYCKKVIESYYDNYPKIKSYFKEKFNKTLVDGYITINDFTFRKYFDDKSFRFVKRIQEVIRNYGYDSVDEQELQDFKIAKSRIERKVKNYSIQGLSADMTKMAMVILLNRILSDDLFDKIKIVLSVHDEIVLESDLDTSEVACKMLEDAMNEAGNMLTSMEFFAEANVGDTWAEAK
jgi:DNA polymerase I